MERDVYEASDLYERDAYPFELRARAGWEVEFFRDAAGGHVIDEMGGKSTQRCVDVKNGGSTGSAVSWTPLPGYALKVYPQADCKGTSMTFTRATHVKVTGLPMKSFKVVKA